MRICAHLNVANDIYGITVDVSAFVGNKREMQHVRAVPQCGMLR